MGGIWDGFTEGVRAVGAARSMVPPPTFAEHPVPVPVADAGRRNGKDNRVGELHEIAYRNLLAAEEARSLCWEQHRRLEQEVAARTRTEWEHQTLARELTELRDEDGRRRAQVKADATREARAAVAQEMDEMALEIDRLRAALADNDRLRAEHLARRRSEQSELQALRAELERAEAARRETEDKLQRATEMVRRHAGTAPGVCEGQGVTPTDAGEIAALQDRLEQMRETLEHERADADALVADANARVAELTAALEQAGERARVAERELGRLRRDASEAGRGRRIAEDALHEVEAERDTLYDTIAASESEVEQARKQVVQLRTELAAAAESLDAACAQLTEVAAETDALRAELAQRPPAGSDGVRRHVMAEFSALAATTGDDAIPSRR